MPEMTGKHSNNFPFLRKLCRGPESSFVYKKDNNTSQKYTFSITNL